MKKGEIQTFVIVIIIMDFVILLQSCLSYDNCIHYSRVLKGNVVKGEFIRRQRSDGKKIPQLVFNGHERMFILDAVNGLYSQRPEELLWNYIMPGDSLFKEEGSLEYVLKRNGDPLKYFYPKCSEKIDIGLISNPDYKEPDK